MTAFDHAMGDHSLHFFERGDGAHGELDVIWMILKIQQVEERYKLSQDYPACMMKLEQAIVILFTGNLDARNALSP